MDNKESVKAMALALRSPKLKTVIMALEMLSAVCFIPGGHDRIMEGADFTLRSLIFYYYYFFFL